MGVNQAESPDLPGESTPGRKEVTAGMAAAMAAATGQVRKVAKAKQKGEQKGSFTPGPRMEETFALLGTTRTSVAGSTVEESTVVSCALEIIRRTLVNQVRRPSHQIQLGLVKPRSEGPEVQRHLSLWTWG